MGVESSDIPKPLSLPLHPPPFSQPHNHTYHFTIRSKDLGSPQNSSYIPPSSPLKFGNSDYIGSQSSSKKGVGAPRWFMGKRSQGNGEEGKGVGTRRGIGFFRFFVFFGGGNRSGKRGRDLNRDEIFISIPPPLSSLFPSPPPPSKDPYQPTHPPKKSPQSFSIPIKSSRHSRSCGEKTPAGRVRE